MEKESNTNSMEETATMPSYFPCIKSSESHPLADWLYLKSVITSNPELRMMTETYRKRLAISKQFADPRPVLLGVCRVSKGRVLSKTFLM